MKKIGFLLSTVLLTGTLAACGSDAASEAKAINEDKIVVGVTADHMNKL